MENDQVPEPTGNERLLLKNERVQLEWSGVVKRREDSYSADFTVTDRRLIFSRNDGHFKDIGLEHIESVEISKGTESNIKKDGTDVGAMFLGGAICLLGGLGWSIAFESVIGTIFAIPLIIAGAGFLWSGVTNFDNRSNGSEVVEYQVYDVILRTSSQSPLAESLHIRTRDQIGVELSKIVQRSS